MRRRFTTMAMVYGLTTVAIVIGLIGCMYQEEDPSQTGRLAPQVVGEPLYEAEIAYPGDWGDHGLTSYDGVPILGDIPVIGRLYSAKSNPRGAGSTLISPS